MGVEDAKKMVTDSIRAAIERDALSGDGIDILVIMREDNKVKAKEESIKLF